MRKYFAGILIFVFLIIFYEFVFCQSDKEKVGIESISTNSSGYFNFGDKDKVNIEINVWGFIRNPGKYIVPAGTTFQDVLSYSGGFTYDTKLDEIMLYRHKNDSLHTKDQLIKLNYNDFFWEDTINLKKINNPVLEPGDVLIFKGSPKYFFRDNLSLITSLASLAVSIVTLFVTLKK